jgi:alkanesulfonate monooxygenase SsuD/methylene tetrahydromethanopterin reductase-like flavin-dependent oxidoreductase (luciferase family)
MTDVYFFTEMPYADFDEKEAEQYPSMRLTFPNKYFNAQRASTLFQEYYDQFQWAEEVGFDGLMINEHHNTPSCMDVAVNLSAAVLGRITKRAKILLLGNMLPTNDNPVRLAEEIAMADVISGGRIIAGVVRGIGIETWANNTVPNYNRERFEECHDLMLATWTRPGPFRWEGKHYHFRVVNPWMVPVQQPHPPIWVPGTGSPETIEWAAKHGYTYAAFLVPMDATVRLYDQYREHAAAEGYEADASNFAYMVCCVCADTDEKAQEIGQHYMWRMGHPLRGPMEYWAPPGYLGQRKPVRSQRGVPRGNRKPLNEMTYEELQEAYHLVVGSPQTVLEKLSLMQETMGFGSLLLEAQAGAMPHSDTMRSLELLGREVIPELKKL